MLKWVRSGKDIGLVATEDAANVSEALSSSQCSGEERSSSQPSISESDSNQMEVSLVNVVAPEAVINGTINGIIRSLSEFRSSDFCDWNSETVSV